MSGPIVRKYGFPNFEAIFGAREIQHGRDDGPDSKPAPGPDESKPDADPKPDRGHGSPPGADATEGEKQSEDSAQL